MAQVSKSAVRRHRRGELGRENPRRAEVEVWREEEAAVHRQTTCRSRKCIIAEEGEEEEGVEWDFEGVVEGWTCAEDTVEEVVTIIVGIPETAVFAVGIGIIKVVEVALTIAVTVHRGVVGS